MMTHKEILVALCRAYEVEWLIGEMPSHFAACAASSSPLLSGQNLWAFLWPEFSPETEILRAILDSIHAEEDYTDEKTRLWTSLALGAASVNPDYIHWSVILLNDEQNTEIIFPIIKKYINPYEYLYAPAQVATFLQTAPPNLRMTFLLDLKSVMRDQLFVTQKLHEWILS